MSHLIEGMISRYGKVVRFLISGGSAAAVNLSLLYVFVEILDIWYIAGSIIAFIVSFFVSFTLQKFWTFRDASTEVMHGQVAKYFFVALINLGVSTGTLYLLVEYVQLPVMLAQVITLGLIAIVSFFVYQRFIFHPTATTIEHKSSQ